MIRGAFHALLGKHSMRHSRCYGSQAIDLRSDTVTLPSIEMLKSAMDARLGDDVMGEDETVLELQEYIADVTGKEQVRGTLLSRSVLMPWSDRRSFSLAFHRLYSFQPALWRTLQPSCLIVTLGHQKL
jgi:hypothetical protein